MATTLPSYLSQYPHVYNTVIPVRQMLSYIPSDNPTRYNGNYELEIRLGRICVNNYKSKFRAGVEEAFINTALAEMERYDWYLVEDWRESHDFYYEIEAKSDQLTDHNILVRTSVEFDQKSNNMRKTHICKHVYKKQDFRFTTTRRLQPTDPTYDLRASISFEENISPKDIPSIAHPHHIRIKSRKSFYYKPSNCEKPVFRYDITRSWTGNSFSEAEQRQRKKETIYEFEIECLNLDEYMASSPSHDAYYVALSLVLKMADFIGERDQFAWRPV